MLASSFSTRFLLRKNRRSRSLPPLGATCSLPHFRFAQMWPRARTPALLVFNSVFAAQKSAQPVTGPTFWVCRAKAGAAFRCAKPPCAVVRFAAMASPPRTAVLPSPSRLRRAGPPTAKPRRLLPFGRISPAAKPRGRSLPPPGATCSLPHFRSAQMWPRARTPALAPVRSHFAPRNRAAGHRPHRGRCFGLPRFRFAQARSPGQNPGPPRFQLGFCCAKTGGRVPPLSDGGALTKSENIILCASSCHPPRSPYPHCTLPRVRFSGIGQKKKPQRKTAAAVNTLYMSCKKTSVNPISFPVALCTKISPFKAIHLLSQCKTKIQFLWMRMRKRSAN